MIFDLFAIVLAALMVGLVLRGELRLNARGKHRRKTTTLWREMR